MAQNKEKMSQFEVSTVAQMLQAGAYVPVVTLPTRDSLTGDAVPGQNYLVPIGELMEALGGSGN